MPSYHCQLQLQLQVLVLWSGHFPSFWQSVSSMWSMASKPSMPRSREQRWSEQDHQRWRYHRRLLDYQSLDSHLKLPFVICTLGDHQYLWIIKVHIVIWNNSVTAIYLVHQRPHVLLKTLLDHWIVGGSSKSLHSYETSCCWYQRSATEHIVLLFLLMMTWQSIWSKLASWTYSGITLDIKVFSLWHTS